MRRVSAGGRKAKRAVARHQTKVAARRRDFLHKLSRRIVRAHSHIALEDLAVRGLAGTRLAKAVHNAAWAQLTAMLSDKAANAGERLSWSIRVDPLRRALDVGRSKPRLCPSGSIAVIAVRFSTGMWRPQGSCLSGHSAMRRDTAFGT